MTHANARRPAGRRIVLNSQQPVAAALEASSPAPRGLLIIQHPTAGKHFVTTFLPKSAADFAIVRA